MTKPKYPTRALSFDSKGINDLDSEYAPRIATFTQPEYANLFGPLFEASPELYRALENIVSSAQLVDLPLALKLNIQEASRLIRQLGAK